MHRKSYFLPLFLFAGMLGSLLLSGRASAQEVRVRIELKGAALNGQIPSGHAEYRAKNGASKFEAEVEDVALPDGTTLHVNINGVEVVTLTLLGGIANRELESQRGDVVPVLQTTDKVTVTTNDGTEILSSDGSGGGDPGPRPDAKLKAPLKDSGGYYTTKTSGKAKYVAKKGKAELEVEVEHITRPDGTKLTVNINGAALGTITVTLKRGNLNLSTQRGDMVPVIKAGDMVTIVDADGLTIMAGAFK